MKTLHKTLEDIIRDNALVWEGKKFVESSEYIISVQQDWKENGLRVYIRPSDRGGDTVDFVIKENDILFVSTPEEVLNTRRTKTIDEMLNG